MKKLQFISAVLFLVLLSQFGVAQNTKLQDNDELKTMYEHDQADRRTDDIDWNIVAEKDRDRETKVEQMVTNGQLKTSMDYYHAAMIYQHGNDTIASGKAVKMMRKAMELDSTRSKWLLAAAIDRDLMRKKQPQIYGTQYTKNGKDAPWTMYKMDTTKVTDKERVEYNVETLAQQREKVKQMNKKKLTELLEEEKSMDEILEFLNNEELSESEYDLSESGINKFGYHLLNKGRAEDAILIFKTNVKLYPTGYNAYDSLGEAFMKMEKHEEGLDAYRKSLELNPENKNAEIILMKFGQKK